MSGRVPFAFVKIAGPLRSTRDRAENKGKRVFFAVLPASALEPRGPVDPWTITSQHSHIYTLNIYIEISKVRSTRSTGSLSRKKSHLVIFGMVHRGSTLGPPLRLSHNHHPRHSPGVGDPRPGVGIGTVVALSMAEPKSSPSSQSGCMLSRTRLSIRAR